jgi:hypothetical protein
MAPPPAAKIKLIRFNIKFEITMLEIARRLIASLINEGLLAAFLDIADGTESYISL